MPIGMVDYSVIIAVLMFIGATYSSSSSSVNIHAIITRIS